MLINSTRLWRLLASVVFMLAAGTALAGSNPKVVSAQPITEGIWVTGQITAAQLADLKARGFGGVVDLRPDGEEVGQPPSTEIAAAAHDLGLGFDYIPVHPGAVTDAAVEALAASLAKAEKPMLIFCKSGQRAARTWALAEASRSEGKSAAEILKAVSATGRSADDLREQIESRIAARAHGQ